MPNIKPTDNREYLKKIMQNQQILCPEIFSEENKLRPEVNDKLLKIADFLKHHIIRCLGKVEISDILICGNLCGYIYNESSDLDFFIFIEKMEGAETLLKNLNHSFHARGFNFNIYGHWVDYSVKDRNLIGSSYSLLKQAWNKEPQRREFSYDFENFYLQYCRLDAEIHTVVSQMPKTSQGFLTPLGCEIMAEYLQYLRTSALETKKHHPEHEYALSYNLYRGLKHMGVYSHFERYLQESRAQLGA